MWDFVMNIGVIGIVVSLGLIIYSMIRRNGLTKRYVIMTTGFFLLFALGFALQDGGMGLSEYIGTASFVLSIMFVWLVIYSLIQKTGEALKYFILAIVCFVVMLVAF